MAEVTGIQWCDATFNPWRGCTKVSTGCANCYAETLSLRNPKVLGEWGDKGKRVIASESYWREPLKWNRAAEKAGERRRVFCASMSDVFEDRPELVVPRERLWLLINSTPYLDWLLLTKRPENFRRLLPSYAIPNIWLGVSVENQALANERIPILCETPAAVRFLSVEPLLGAIDFTDGPADPSESTIGEWSMLDGIDWVIIGGESVNKARPCHVEWVLGVKDQCEEAGVPVFVKQLGSHAICERIEFDMFGNDVRDDERLALVDPKGGDMEEWPLDLRVREFPKARQ